jgi:hypothetical protein
MTTILILVVAARAGTLTRITKCTFYHSVLIGADGTDGYGSVVRVVRVVVSALTL